jgi:hypothetical protein
MDKMTEKFVISILVEALNLIGDGFRFSAVPSVPTEPLKKCVHAIDSKGIDCFDQLLHGHVTKNLSHFKASISAGTYVIEKMSHGFNRLGKAHGKGFFNYDTDPPTLWSGLKVFEKRSFNIPEQDITDRLAFAAVIGALQTTEEEAASIDPEIKALIPPGFPLSRQEALSWIDNYGESRFATRMAELAAAYGKRFADPRSAPPNAE